MRSTLSRSGTKADGTNAAVRFGLASLLFILSSAPLLGQTDGASRTLTFSWPIAGDSERAFGAPDGAGGIMRGVSFAVKEAAALSAAADGVTVYAGPFRSYGSLLILGHGCGLHSIIAGAVQPSAAIGQKVRRGEQVGSVSAGSQVYFELRRDGAVIDPASIMPPLGAPSPHTVTCSDVETAKANPVPPDDELSSAVASAPPPAVAGVSSEKIAWTGKLPWPVRGKILRAFGAGGMDGIDIAVPEGTKVKAVAKGIVIYAGDGLKELGNTVLVRHEDSLVTVYGNLSELKVRRGQTVKRGDVIGKSGKSGAAPGPQLHFQVRKKSAPMDPAAFLRAP